MNFLTAEAAGRDDKGLEIGGKSGLRLALPVAAAGSQRSGDKLTVGVRPEDLRLADPAKALLSGEVQIAEQLGGETFLYVTLASGETIVVEVQGQVTGKAGERVGIDFEPSAYHVFAADGRVLARRTTEPGAAHRAGDAAFQLAAS
jgi:ABC-type sugar transport system ATPase subunit